MNNIDIQEQGVEILKAIEHYNECVKTQNEYVNMRGFDDFYNIRERAKHDKEIFLMCIIRLKERFEKNQSKIKL